MELISQVRNSNSILSNNYFSAVRTSNLQAQHCCRNRCRACKARISFWRPLGLLEPAGPKFHFLWFSCAKISIRTIQKFEVTRLSLDPACFFPWRLYGLVRNRIARGVASKFQIVWPNNYFSIRSNFEVQPARAIILVTFELRGSTRSGNYFSDIRTSRFDSFG